MPYRLGLLKVIKTTQFGTNHITLFINVIETGGSSFSLRFEFYRYACTQIFKGGN